MLVGTWREKTGAGRALVGTEPSRTCDGDWPSQTPQRARKSSFLPSTYHFSESEFLVSSKSYATHLQRFWTMKLEQKQSLFSFPQTKAVIFLPLHSANTHRDTHIHLHPLARVFNSVQLKCLSLVIFIIALIVVKLSKTFLRCLKTKQNIFVYQYL